MVQYWVDFAYSGDPNRPVPGQQQPPPLPTFPRYGGGGDSDSGDNGDVYVVFGDDVLKKGAGNAKQAGARLGWKGAQPPQQQQQLLPVQNITTVTGLKSGKCAFWDTYEYGNS